MQAFQKDLSLLLGSTNLRPIAVHMEPFSTSVFKVLVCIFATITKICTGVALPMLATEATSVPSYTSSQASRPDGRVWVRHLSAIHFQGWLIRQVSYYIPLGKFRLPWPSSCCIYQPTPFMGSDGHRFRHLNPAFASSHITSSAYQKWPTGNSGIPYLTSI